MRYKILLIILFLKILYAEETHFYPQVGVTLEEIPEEKFEIKIGEKKINLGLEFNFPTSRDHLRHHTSSCPDTRTRKNVEKKLIISAKNKFYSNPRS